MDVAPPTADEVQPEPSRFRPLRTKLKQVPADRASQPGRKDIGGWCDLLLSAGVQADRIASPDLLGQLRQAQHRASDTIICSVLDTDPGVPFNATIAESFTTEMSAGLKLLTDIAGVGRVWITADPEKSSDWFTDLADALQNPAVRLVPLRGDYPQTDSTLMLYTLLQRKLAPGQLPTEKRAILIDAAAAVMVGRCVLHAAPLGTVEIALRDHFQQKTHFLSVPPGVSLGEVCDFLEITRPEAVFRAGDFLRDHWMQRDAKLGHGELIIHSTARQLDANPDPCIHCGWCLEACPTRIHPAGLLDAAQRADPGMGKKFGVDACIECGICSYVCPTRLPLLGAIRDLKTLSKSR